MIETIGDATLYLGDCREILPTLGRVDAVVTDPPYGVRTAYLSHDDSTIDEVLPRVQQALGVAKRALIFPGIPNAWKYPEPDDIGWAFSGSDTGMSPWGMRCGQPMLYYGKRPVTGCYPTGFNGVYANDANQVEGHPCPKPIRVMLWAVNRASLPGEAVCDPFMGSGTTGVACARLGRRFIGIEIEPRYFEIACKRIDEAQRQGRLFDPPRPKPKQDVLFGADT